MKTSKIITLAMMALALSATPALAQRGGGGSRGGGSSHSSSMSSSRSSGSSFSSSSSRSSSSSHSSYSSPSRSSSSSHSSYSSPSRSSSSSRSYSAPSRSSSPSSVRNSSRSEARQAPSVHGAREAGMTHGRSGVRDASVSSSRSGAREAGVAPGRSAIRGTGVAPSRRGDPSSARRDVTAGSPRVGSHSGAPTSTSTRVSTGRANDVTPYARPGRPGGVMPPSHRPIHPAPYFHHPYHRHYVHCHPIFWDPIPPRPWYWPGFWHYCNSYWYDYHVTDVVVVHKYVQDQYNVDLVTYGISGDIMYAIVRDGGDTYLQVYDKDDHLLAEQKINRKYCNMVIDSENGGCWISKKNEKDPLLFIWADGQLLIYEED